MDRPMRATIYDHESTLQEVTRMIKVMATLVSKADKVADTQAALSSLVAPTMDEEGCISYELFQSDDDPTEFVTIEEWADQASIDQHMASDHIAAALAAAADILAADPKITSYNKIA